MGADDGVCEDAPDGVHAFALVELLPGRGGVGMAQLHRCSWCGVEAYEASAADDPRRRPLA